MPAVTLSPAAPSVTLTGLTSAYGTIGAYYINVYPGPPDLTEPVEAAIFGTQTTNFNILNSGTILSPGTSQFDAGIVLGGVGAVKNTGTIDAPAGIFILGYRHLGSLATGAYVGNFGTIIATKGEGIDVLGAGGVNNSGFISAATGGIFDNGGLVENFGTIIAGNTAIFQRGGTGLNNGTIQATGKSGTGVVTYGTFTNSSTAAITATGKDGLGILGINYSAVYNYGKISAATGIVLTTAASFYNTGLITATNTGIYQGLNRDPYANGPAYITNYGGGKIAGKKFGIRNDYASAYIYNAGLITGATAVTDNGVILNLGTIKGTTDGVVLYNGTLTNTGTISADTAIAGAPLKNIPFTATIDNAGKITGQTGILTAGGFVTNTGYIEARANAGIELTAAGQVYNGVSGNTITGTISGATTGVSLSAGGTVTNTGIILSGGGDGLDLSTASALYNKYTITHLNGVYARHIGTISGARYGVSLAGAGYLKNQLATITGGSAAVYLRGVTATAIAAGQSAAIENNGTLTGTQYGILSRYGTIKIGTDYNEQIRGQTAILAADAYITLGGGYVGGNMAGIFLTQGGTIINHGEIAGHGSTAAAIYAGTAGAKIVNDGDVFGPYGIVLAGPGYLFNGDAIDSSTIGVDFKSGGTIINQGYIDAYNSAGAIVISGGTVVNLSHARINGAVIFGTGANRLILDPGSTIEGYYAGPTRTAATVNLDGGILELGSVNGSIGTVFAFDEGGASAVTIDQGANWSLATGQHFAASAKITNNGTIRQLSGPGATIAAAITGHGEIALSAGTITLDGPVGPSQKVKFLTAGAGDLALGDPSHFKAAIQNFGLHETINLTGLALSNVQNLSFAGGVLTLTETTGQLTFTFSNPTHFAGETFSAFADGPGTGITLAPVAAPSTTQNAPAWLTNNLTQSPTNTTNLITLQT
jgi:hypothetical protein